MRSKLDLRVLQQFSSNGNGYLLCCYFATTTLLLLQVLSLSLSLHTHKHKDKRKLMTKVYPKAVIPPLVSSDRHRFFTESSTAGQNPVVLTVWKKSLLFSCHGFTVFDTKGNLVFRVDNYAAASKAEVVLMDASGRSLLTTRRKKLSLTDSWLVYDGEMTVNPRFSVTKHVNFLNAKSLAHVTCTGSGSNKKKVAYEIEGSYAQRCCVVYDDKRRRVAEMKRKEAVGGVRFGGDVFRLVVQPDMDSSVAMALVVLLFGGSSSRW